MNHLLRELAPIPDKAWDLVEQEAAQQLKGALAARRLVDFAGPAGWEHSAVALGRTSGVAATPVEGVTALRRQVLPLVEPRASFTVSRADVADADRGAVDLDFGSLDAAARRMARTENIAVFHGWEQAGVGGITQASTYDAIALTDAFADYPRHVAKAVELLLCEGIDGPYGLALSPSDYTGVVETTEHGGYPTFEHLREILGGPLVWAPGVSGAVVVSLRGGDFLFECGQDLSIGYERHDADAVHLYFEESFTFRVVTPEAAVPLTRAA
jgi:uncharacterized linocin/CFP29 family protein